MHAIGCTSHCKQEIAQPIDPVQRMLVHRCAVVERHHRTFATASGVPGKMQAGGVLLYIQEGRVIEDEASLAAADCEAFAFTEAASHLRYVVVYRAGSRSLPQLIEWLGAPMDKAPCLIAASDSDTARGLNTARGLKTARLKNVALP